MEIDPAEVTERLKGTLSDLLGMRVVEATPDRVVAELVIRDEIRTVGGSLHGGTLMALADTIGATATDPEPARPAPARPRSSPRPISSRRGARVSCARSRRRSIGASALRSGKRASPMRAGACSRSPSRPRWS